MFRPVFRALSRGGARGKLNVFIFHRVLPAPDPLFPEEIDVQVFTAMLGWLAAWFEVLPLADAIERLHAGRLPPRAAAITFDDGYADNWTHATPCLQARGMHATFFVATDFLDGGCMWNDVIIESLRRCTLPELDLSFLGQGRLALGAPAQRRAAIDALIGRIKYLAHGERIEVVTRLAEQAGVRIPGDLMMSSEELRCLQRAGMEIGGHTASHPILARIPDADARAEIAKGREILQGITGEPVRLFAYPNGKPGQDYDDRHVAMVRELGFQAAVSTHWAYADAGSDRFQLPRFTPWDRSRARFGLRMMRNLLQ